ncbi:MAG: glycosyltransferase family 2 protein [Bacilli bacterium]
MVDITLVLFLLFIALQTMYVIVPLRDLRIRKLNTTIGEKGMSIIVPAYNEELTIANCLQSMMKLNYNNYELIFVNDGSKDDTLGVLQHLLQLEQTTKQPAGRLKYAQVRGLYQSTLYNNIFVIDKYNGGKADSLNAGMDYATHDYVVTLDADSMLEKQSLKYVNDYFEDQTVVGLGGTVLIVQGAQYENDRVKIQFTGNGIVKHQMLHYIHGFFVKKLTQARFNSMVVISGAFGAFEKDLMYAINGFRHTVGEDMDITLKIYQHLKKIGSDRRLVYAREAVCFTECPENLTNFNKQRIRWQQGFTDCVLQYWGRLNKDFNLWFILFFAIDGLLIGTITGIITFVSIINLFFRPELLVLAVAMFLIVTVLDIVQQAISLVSLAKIGYVFTKREYLAMFFFSFIERITYKMIPIYINIIGSIKFFLTEEKWNPLQRKGKAIA